MVRKAGKAAAAPQMIHLLIAVATELALDTYIPVILPGGCTVTGMSAAATFEVVGTNLILVLAQPDDGPSVTLPVGTGSDITVASEAPPWAFPYGPAPTVTKIRLIAPAETFGYIAVLITYTP